MHISFLSPSLSLPLSLYIHDIYTRVCAYVGGWGGESNWDIVLLRPCMRTHGLVVDLWSGVWPQTPGNAFPISLVRVQCVLMSFNEFE